MKRTPRRPIDNPDVIAAALGFPIRHAKGTREEMLLIKLFRVRHSLSWLIHCINGAASDAGLTTPGNYAIASVPQRLKRNAAKTVAEKKLVELFKKAEKLHLELMND